MSTHNPAQSAGRCLIPPQRPALMTLRDRRQRAAGVREAEPEGTDLEVGRPTLRCLFCPTSTRNPCAHLECWPRPARRCPRPASPLPARRTHQELRLLLPRGPGAPEGVAGDGAARRLRASVPASVGEAARTQPFTERPLCVRTLGRGVGRELHRRREETGDAGTGDRTGASRRCSARRDRRHPPWPSPGPAPRELAPPRLRAGSR